VEAWGRDLLFDGSQGAGLPDTQSKEKVDYLLFMDIVVKNPIARFRVESTHCAYAELGEKMKLDTLDNFKEIMEELSPTLPGLV